MNSDYFQATYEEEFKRYLIVAKSFVERLKKSKDRKICVHWIRRLTSLKSCNDATVGRNRNLFFRHFLKVIQQAVLEDMLKDDSTHILNGFTQMPIQGLDRIEDPAWLDKELDVPILQQKDTETEAPYFVHWADDQKTYIAVKALPGKGALVYMAVATDPSLGWSNLVD